MMVTVHQDFIGIEIPVEFIKFLICCEIPIMVELLQVRKIVFSPLILESLRLQALIGECTQIMLILKGV